MPTSVLPPVPAPVEVSSITRRIGLVSTYPPTLCGLATFSAALGTALRHAGHRVEVVAVDRPPVTVRRGGAVDAIWTTGDRASMRSTVAVLERCDVALIQHEYGIFGGDDGDEVVDLLRALTVPTIVTLHTVPLHPTSGQRNVLDEIVRLAGSVVVMSRAAGTRLASVYGVAQDRIVTIPHGAAVPERADHLDDVRHRRHGRPTLLTWGLLGPGKGIEHAIDALALLGDMPRRPRYIIAGVTHPKVLEREGDRYRQALMRRAWAAGVAGSVTFDESYRDVADLTRLVTSAAAVVLPYDSRDQVTSGVLVDALAAGRPVIATAFPHAVELLGDGTGIVVPHADARALAVAIRSVLIDDDVAERLEARATALAPHLSWGAVANGYARLADRLAAVPIGRTA